MALTEVTSITEIRNRLEQGTGFILHERQALEAVADLVEKVRAMSPEQQAAFVVEAVDSIARHANGGLGSSIGLKAAVDSVLRKPGALAFTSEQATALVQNLSTRSMYLPMKSVLKSLEGVPLTDELRQSLRSLRDHFDSYWHGAALTKDILGRIKVLLEPAAAAKASVSDMVPPLHSAGPWSKIAFESIAFNENWRRLFHHAKAMTQADPPQKWRAAATAIVEKIGPAAFVEKAQEWLAIGPMPGNNQIQMPEEEADLQRGFIWSIGAHAQASGNTTLVPLVADFAVDCFRKIPQLGAVSHKTGNACVNALAAVPGLAAVAQLSRLSQRIKYDVAQRLIEKALSGAAERNGVSRDHLESMSVSRFGLDANGKKIEILGPCSARIELSDDGPSLQWINVAGKPSKSIPAEIKENHGEIAAGLKRELKELEAVYATQRLRLERMLSNQPVFSRDNWREWFIDHPVVGSFARQLIWEFAAGETGIWHEGRILSTNGVEVGTDSPTVRLWHPIASDPQIIFNWRCSLEDHKIRQPFKQAHREVYLLTPAERETSTYSNRFAGHIIRQHQFAALCRERGWQFQLMGHWDGHNVPSLDLRPRYDLIAEFDVDVIEDSESSGHMVYLLVKTGAVRFVKPGKDVFPIHVPLAEVSSVLFSEVMRDIDLFVGVTSIGADPEWIREPARPHQEYWNSFAYGDLTEASENRRAIVERLIPKLAIASQCRLEGRFLVVKGQLHEYKIHLGSGNVLLEPGSRYLCIVQGPGDSAEKVFLPFDRDRVLSGILSKALLLADDHRIKDPSILRQLERSS
jgi:hypothetical protein